MTHNVSNSAVAYDKTVVSRFKNNRSNVVIHVKQPVAHSPN